MGGKIMKIISVEFDAQKYARIEHSDGSVRVVPPLYSGQMLWKGKDGIYRYDKKVPSNYWEKYDFLKSKGWDTGYHYDDWHKGFWTEYGGIKTDDAVKKEVTSAKELIIK